MSSRGPKLPWLSMGVSLPMRLHRIVPSGQTQPEMCWVTCLPPSREMWELDLATSCKEADPCACWASPGLVITEADWLACDRKADWISPLDDRALRVSSLVPYLTPTLQISKSGDEGSDRPHLPHLAPALSYWTSPSPKPVFYPYANSKSSSSICILDFAGHMGKKILKKCSPLHPAVVASYKE